MNGPEIRVFGNAQDGVANTMNAGKIVVHGKCGEIPGHSMRGGTLFIRGDVEYRAGIHMKEYLTQIPILVIGGTAKDYCGEYMAGGRIVVLNLENRKESPLGDFVGTGIHGGVIYVMRTGIPPSAGNRRRLCRNGMMTTVRSWRGYSRRFALNSTLIRKKK
jgi:glutamate synthase domain-containing protein 3